MTKSSCNYSMNCSEKQNYSRSKYNEKTQRHVLVVSIAVAEHRWGTNRSRRLEGGQGLAHRVLVSKRSGSAGAPIVFEDGEWAAGAREGSL